MPQNQHFPQQPHGWCSAKGTAVWAALCAGYQGMPTESLFVCFSGGRASAHGPKCIFCSCCTISFQVSNLLAHFCTSWWPHHHHIKHDLKKEKTGGGSILVLPILPSLFLPTRLPSFPSSLPTSVTQQKPTSEKLTKEMFHKKKFRGTLSLTHTHTKGSFSNSHNHPVNPKKANIMNIQKCELLNYDIQLVLGRTVLK